MGERIERSYPANPERLVAHMMKKGYSAIELARKSGVDEKTIRRLINGARGSLHTFQRLAAGLGLKNCVSLYKVYKYKAGDPYRPPVIMDDALAYVITITILDDGTDSPSETAITFIRETARLCGKKALITVEQVRKGSVILELRANMEACEGFLYLFCTAQLYQWRVHEIRIASEMKNLPLHRPLSLASDFLASVGSKQTSSYKPDPDYFSKTGKKEVEPGIYTLDAPNGISVRLQVHNPRKLVGTYLVLEPTGMRMFSV
jgi:hypothetical protein